MLREGDFDIVYMYTAHPLHYQHALAALTCKRHVLVEKPATMTCPTYISYSHMSSNFASSFDFGHRGYAASCNYGGELIHLSAKSATRGLIFARGNRCTSLSSSLAQAQGEFGGPATFGLEVSRNRDPGTPSGVAGDKFEREHQGFASQSSFRPGQMIERGSFSHRWPFHEYLLLLNDNSKSRMDDRVFGTYSILSFIDEGVCYQVLRLEANARHDSAPLPATTDVGTRIVLTIGGDLFFQTFAQATKRRNDAVTKLNVAAANAEDDKTATQHHPRAKAVRPETADTVRIYSEDKTMFVEYQVYYLVGRDKKPFPLQLIESEECVDSSGKQGRHAAYNAYLDFKHGEFKDNIVFVAAFRIRDTATVKLEEAWNPPINSARFYKRVIADPCSPGATGNLWETIFLEKGQSGAGLLCLLSESHLVGRCLAKILDVEMCPTIIHTVDSGDVEVLAPVSNIFIYPNVDLKAAFWKIRFLVQLHNFLASLTNKHRQFHVVLDDDQKEALRSVTARIKDAVEGVTRFLTESLLRPRARSPQQQPLLMPDNFVEGESNYYYVLPTIYYVHKHMETLFPANSLRGPVTKWELSAQERLPEDSFNFDRCDRDKVVFLKWYHYASLLKLHQAKVDFSRQEQSQQAPPKDEVLEPIVLKQDVLEQKVRNLCRAAKVASSTRLTSRRPYEADDEIFDRLALLGPELKFTDTSDTLIETLSKEHIKQRSFTTNLNPGWRKQYDHRARTGPWEIYALCHHSRLMVMSVDMNAKEDDAGGTPVEYEVEKFEQLKTRLCHFLNSEGTVVPCWERAYGNASRGWLRSEATAIVAYTLVNINDKLLSLTTADEMNRSPSRRSSWNRENTPAGPRHRSSQQSLGSSETVYREQMMKDMNEIRDSWRYALHKVETLEGTRAQEAQSQSERWLGVFEPPAKYHPEGFVESLRDTPWIYNGPMLASRVTVQGTLKDFVTWWDQGYPTASSDHFAETKLCNILETEYLKGFRRQWRAGIKQDQGILSITDIVDPDTMTEGLSGTVQQIILSIITKVPSAHEVEAIKKSINLVLSKLNENLVNQNVQHRFLTVRRLPPGFLDYLIYVLQPRSTACLTNHVLNLSRFSCQRRDKWTASITLKTWYPYTFGEKATSDNETIRARNLIPLAPPLDEIPQRPYRDPTHVYFHRSKFLESHQLMLSPKTGLLLKVSSISLATNDFGDFSKCLIISTIYTDRDVLKVANNAQKLWQTFAHQPQTARCLVFLLLLGSLCKEMAKWYGRSAELLTDTHTETGTPSTPGTSTGNSDAVSGKENDAYVPIDDKYINDPREFLDMLDKHPELQARYNADNEISGAYRSSSNDVAKYWLRGAKRSILLQIQISLKECVETTQQAKEELMVQIQEDQLNRGPDLERSCQWYLGTFEDQFSRLKAVRYALDGQIETISRSMDVFSNVSGMVDSKVSLDQNRTIQKLTYLTIAYLPMGFLAAVFAIPPEQFVTFSGMGLRWFVYGILIMLAATSLAAWQIDPVITVMSYLVMPIVWPLKHIWKFVEPYSKQFWKSVEPHLPAVLQPPHPCQAALEHIRASSRVTVESTSSKASQQPLSQRARGDIEKKVRFEE
ncbi:hypothetical protein BR93DRAFT_970622 [Coniochaeta sp. PMI_546]|nr:hypothetical protein BR93DRAFT_970622 [Coniochaeta sp. PMI_546]